MSCSKVSWGYSPSPKVISMHTHILKIWILSNRPGFKFSAIKDSILVQFIIYGLQLKCSRHVKSQRIKTKAKKFHEKTKIQNTTETLYAMIKFLTYICNKSNLMFWWLTFSESSFSVHKKHHNDHTVSTRCSSVKCRSWDSLCTNRWTRYSTGQRHRPP